MNGLRYRIQCVRRFLDGNVWPRQITEGEILEVDAHTWALLSQSDPEGFQVLGKVIPLPVVAQVEPVVYHDPTPTPPEPQPVRVAPARLVKTSKSRPASGGKRAKS